MANNVDSREIVEIRMSAGMFCHRHPTYRGLRAPRKACDVCHGIYARRKLSGATERRVRERGRTIKVKGKGESLTHAGLIDYKMRAIDGRVDDTFKSDLTIGAIVNHLTNLNHEKHLMGEA